MIGRLIKLCSHLCRKGASAPPRSTSRNECRKDSTSREAPGDLSLSLLLISPFSAASRSDPPRLDLFALSPRLRTGKTRTPARS